jgi:hypothetical protein
MMNEFAKNVQSNFPLSDGNPMKTVEFFAEINPNWTEPADQNWDEIDQVELAKRVIIGFRNTIGTDALIWMGVNRQNRVVSPDEVIHGIVCRGGVR